MKRRTTAALLECLSLEEGIALPLYRQLYQQLRDAVVAGRLNGGTRLPSSRMLAIELGVSRNTVTTAYELLLAEGYLDAAKGSGTYVTEELPDQLLRASQAKPVGSEEDSNMVCSLSTRGKLLVELSKRSPTARRSRAFSPGMPDLAAFPLGAWTKLLMDHWRRAPASFFMGGDPAGYKPLREALAAHLAATRAVNCDPEQVIIVSGSQQALDLVARTLVDAGDQVWLEDPSFQGTRGAFVGAGAELKYIPVDEEGLEVAHGVVHAPNARLAVVVPAHQYPLGVTMSLPRRAALLEWSASLGSYILEDDYDSEYRYGGAPLAALQSLDRQGRVIYCGTLSKVMFPALRIGYLIAPPSLVDAFLSVRRHLDSEPPSLAQAALAEFVREGHLASHIRRMRIAYRARQEVLVDSIQKYLSGAVEASPDSSGMHLVAYLVERVDDVRLANEAAQLGIEAPALSKYYSGVPLRRGLVLGYAGVEPKEIDRQVRKLATLFR